MLHTCLKTVSNMTMEMVYICMSDIIHEIQSAICTCLQRWLVTRGFMWFLMLERFLWFMILRCHILDDLVSTDGCCFNLLEILG